MSLCCNNDESGNNDNINIPSNVIITCEKASSVINDTRNGWSWKTLGMCNQKQLYNYEYDIYCYQHALRCQDIEYPTTIDFYSLFHILSSSSS